MSAATATETPSVPATTTPIVASVPATTTSPVAAVAAVVAAVEGEEVEAEEGLTLRALVSSKEAGVIIGRGGATIATLRSESNVKAGVSKVVPGVADRILSIGGSVDGVAKAYSLIAQTILDNPVPSQSQTDTPSASTSTTIRLLISHLLIGSVIGKGGAKIRQIQDVSGARMVASKEMLPQSTERIVEVSGGSESIRVAVAEISRCLIEDWDRSQGTVLYHPGAEGGMMGNGYNSNNRNNNNNDGGNRSFGGDRRIGGGNSTGNNSSYGNQRRNNNNNNNNSEGGERNFSSARERNNNSNSNNNNSSDAAPIRRAPAGEAGISSSDPNYREQKISIPSDMVGCIIGRAGTKINEIRRLSGSKISIAKTAHDETGERMFVISGLPEHNEKALFLLYNQLESEKERRVQNVAEEDGAQEA